MTTTTWGRLRRHRGGQAGIALAAAVTAAGVLGPLLTGHDPNQPDYANQLAAPGAAHWLGTDDAGRDQLARTLAGTRTSLQAVAVVVALTTATGLLVGGIAGYVRGLVDAAVGRLIDVMLGLPGQIVALAVVGALGAGSGNLVLAVVVGGWAYPARVARAAVLGSHDRLEVLAARLAGIPDRRIFATHVLPATVATVAVAAATGVGEVVLILAGLSFLGLGAQPPTAELGQMLADSQSALASSPWLLVGPSVVIAAMVTAALLLSDALRDAADPAAPAPTRGSPPRRRWPPAAPRPRSPHAATAGVRRAPPAAALSVRDLTVTYADGSRAVRGVSLALDSGTCLAVVGESGCGKTSLSRAILRLLPPGAQATGEVCVAGTDVLVADGTALRRLRGRLVGYVAQDPYAACDPLRTVAHHVSEAWTAHRQRPATGEVARRVADLGVTDAGRRLAERPHRWSGGMLQRATVAAASAHRPVVTVADEPTSALDADLADDVLATIRRASRAVLLVSHDLRLVAAHSDHLAVMYAGRIVETGPTADVLAHPRHPYTKALLAASPRPGGPPVAALPGYPPTNRGVLPPACPFTPRCTEATDPCRDREPMLVDGVACWHAGAR